MRTWRPVAAVCAAFFGGGQRIAKQTQTKPFVVNWSTGAEVQALMARIVKPPPGVVAPAQQIFAQP